MDQEKIDAYNEQRAASSEEHAKTEDTAFALHQILKSQKDIEKSVKESILALVNFLSKHEPKVSVANQPDFPNVQPVVTSINKLLKQVEKKETDFTQVVSSLDALAKSIAQLPTEIPSPLEEVAVSNQVDYSDKFDEITKAVGKLPAPIVNVEKSKIPDNSKELEKIVKAVEKIKFPAVPKTDLKPLLEATNKISKTISNLSFPVPNYVLPFKDVEGAAAQVQLDSSGRLPTTATLVTGDIEIGAVELKNGTDDTRATVTAANALKVDGSAVTQPVSGTVTETNSAAILADTANIDTATAAINAKMVSGTDIGDVTINNTTTTPVPVQPPLSGYLNVSIDQTGNNNAVDVLTMPTITETNSAAIKTAVETIDNAISGSEMQVDVITMPTVTTTESVPTTIYNGKKTVTTAGTRVTLASSTTVKSVTIKALSTNTGFIYVGDTTVASTNGFQLSAGETISMDIANLNTVNLDSSVSGESVTYIGVN